MSIFHKATSVTTYLAVCGVLLHLTAMPAAAAEGAGDWRTTFDLIMRWLNFLILAFVLVKYARLPLKNFLAGKQDQIAREIEAVESEKAQMVRQIEETRQQLENSQERLADLKTKIVAQGEKNRQAIIEAAERESGLMMAAARQRIEARVNAARKTLQAEMVDAAVAMALRRLPAHITDQDNDRFIDMFLSNVSKGAKG